jgi:hypothetical protein
MNEQDLRSIVREAVARHMGSAQLPSPPVPQLPSRHASHVLFTELINVTDACVIEPAVLCDHCGYCKSHGH